MTANTTTDVGAHLADRPHPFVREGLVAAGLAAVGLGFANFYTTDGQNGSASDFAMMLPVALVLTVVLFGWVLPRSRPEGPARLWLAPIAFLSLAAFWAGLPMVLGVAAAVAGRRAGSVVFTTIGALIAAASITICIVG